MYRKSYICSPAFDLSVGAGVRERSWRPSAEIIITSFQFSVGLEVSVCVDVFSPAILTKCLIRREKFCLFFNVCLKSCNYTQNLSWIGKLWFGKRVYIWAIHTHEHIMKKICMGCAWPKPIIKWTQYIKMLKFFFQQTTLFQLKTVIVFHVLSYLKRSSLCFQFAVYTYDQVIIINND